MIEKVSHKFAKANQPNLFIIKEEKVKSNQLGRNSRRSLHSRLIHSDCRYLQKLESIEKSLNMEHEETERIMTRFIKSKEVNQSIDGSSERAVEPSSTLSNQFSDSCFLSQDNDDFIVVLIQHFPYLRRHYGQVGHTFRYICLSLCRFDITKMPFITSFSDQFKAKDTILSQEHILFAMQ